MQRISRPPKIPEDPLEIRLGAQVENQRFFDFTDAGGLARRAPKRVPPLLRCVSGIHVLALPDQAVVSAASFLTMVIIGRATDPSQLGAYAIAIAQLASPFPIRAALIPQPY